MELVFTHSYYFQFFFCSKFTSLQTDSLPLKHPFFIIHQNFFFFLKDFKKLYNKKSI